jgi:hypothetical protein
MPADPLTIAIAALAFIAGTLGAWLVYTDLRDSKRRFEARRRLGLELAATREKLRGGSCCEQRPGFAQGHIAHDKAAR